MEKFFEAGTLTDEELVAGLRTRDDAPAKLFPLVCTSAALNIGVQQLLDAIARLPAVARRSAVHGRSTRPATRSQRDRLTKKRPAAAFVWKTIADPFAGRITMFRVVSGSLEVRFHRAQQDDATRAERLGHLDAAAGQDADARCRRSRPAISAPSPS